MRSVARILIVLLVVAALPLRGYAAVAAEFCAGGHGAVQAQGVEHDHHHSPGDMSGHDGDRHSTPSSCSHCASCSVGATLAADSTQDVSIPPSSTDRIPFFDARKPGYVPEHPDRPPLGLSSI